MREILSDLLTWAIALLGMAMAVKLYFPTTTPREIWEQPDAYMFGGFVVLLVIYAVLNRRS